MVESRLAQQAIDSEDVQTDEEGTSAPRDGKYPNKTATQRGSRIDEGQRRHHGEKRHTLEDSDAWNVFLWFALHSPAAREAARLEAEVEREHKMRTLDWIHNQTTSS